MKPFKALFAAAALGSPALPAAGQDICAPQAGDLFSRACVEFLYAEAQRLSEDLVQQCDEVDLQLADWGATTKWSELEDGRMGCLVAFTPSIIVGSGAGSIASTGNRMMTGTGVITSPGSVSITVDSLEGFRDMEGIVEGMTTQDLEVILTPQALEEVSRAINEAPQLIQQ